MCPWHGISGAAFYQWKAKFGGPEATEAERLRTLEENNAKLTKLLAGAMPDIADLSDLSTKNADARREAKRGRPRPGVARGE